jgi:hypothetical protein
MAAAVIAPRPTTTYSRALAFLAAVAETIAAPTRSTQRLVRPGGDLEVSEQLGRPLSGAEIRDILVRVADAIDPHLSQQTVVLIGGAYTPPD